MSLDIALLTDGRPVPWEDIATWLGAREHWTVRESQATYENGDTGVYFLLDLNKEAGDEAPLVAAINVYRPNFFFAEIGPEVEALVDRFALVRGDHDEHRIVRRRFDVVELEAEWRQGNALAHRSIAPGDPALLEAPGEVLSAAWRWNRGRAELQRRYGDDVFVPGMMAVASGPWVETAVVWTDAIPTLLPVADHVIVLRDRLRRRFSTHDLRLMHRRDLVALLGELSASNVTEEGVVTQPGSAVEAWLRALPRHPVVDFRTVSWDLVHDSELVAGLRG